MKTLKRILVLGILLGLGLLVLQAVMGWDNSQAWSLYWKFALVFIVGTAGLYTLYQVYYARKINQAYSYYQNKDYATYLKELDKLAETARGKNLRAVLHLNQAAAYLELDQADQAFALLESINEKKLPSEDLKVTYAINLATAHLKLDRKQAFIQVYTHYQPLFDKYQDHANYQAALAELEVSRISMV